MTFCAVGNFYNNFAFFNLCTSISLLKISSKEEEEEEAKAETEEVVEEEEEEAIPIMMK